MEKGRAREREREKKEKEKEKLKRKERKGQQNADSSETPQFRTSLIHIPFLSPSLFFGKANLDP